FGTRFWPQKATVNLSSRTSNELIAPTCFGRTKLHDEKCCEGACRRRDGGRERPFFIWSLSASALYLVFICICVCRAGHGWGAVGALAWRLGLGRPGLLAAGLIGLGVGAPVGAALTAPTYVPDRRLQDPMPPLLWSSSLDTSVVYPTAASATAASIRLPATSPAMTASLIFAKGLTERCWRPFGLALPAGRFL